MADRCRSYLRIPSKTYFAIVFEGRTGSSYVVSCLNSHPGVMCYPEVLQDLSAEQQDKVLRLLVSGEPIERINPRTAQPAYFHGPIGSGTDLAAVGFKTKLSDVCDVRWLRRALAQGNFRLVYLKRRNIVKAVVSELNVSRLRRRFGPGVSNVCSRDHVLGHLHVDPEQLVAKLRRRIEREEAHERFYKSYPASKIRLFYEDLLADRSGFFARLLSFLKLPDLPLKGRFVKSLPDDLRVGIRNYSEIRHLLSETHFQQLLEER